MIAAARKEIRRQDAEAKARREQEVAEQLRREDERKRNTEAMERRKTKGDAAEREVRETWTPTVVFEYGPLRAAVILGDPDPVKRATAANAVHLIVNRLQRHLEETINAARSHAMGAAEPFEAMSTDRLFAFLRDEVRAAIGHGTVEIIKES